MVPEPEGGWQVMRNGAHAYGMYVEQVRSCRVGHGRMASRIVGEGEGVAVCEAIALALEIAEKSQHQENSDPIIGS